MPDRLSSLLAETVESELPNLRRLSDPHVSGRPGNTDSWSPKQELGHLIDSAANNHIRFVRGALEPEFSGPGYAQNDWVDLHGYQQMPWDDIVALWYGYNLLLSKLIANIPEASLANRCRIGGGEPATLAFLIEDYVLHMRHHIDHILKRPDITPYPPASPCATAKI